MLTGFEKYFAGRVSSKFMVKSFVNDATNSAVLKRVDTLILDLSLITGDISDRGKYFAR